MAKDPTPPFVRRPKASADRTAIADEARQHEKLPPPTDPAREKADATDPRAGAGSDAASEIDPAFASAVDRIASDVIAAPPI